jgi:hypothetical protein
MQTLIPYMTLDKIKKVIYSSFSDRGNADMHNKALEFHKRPSKTH